MNMNVWNSLDDDTKKFFQTELPKLEEEMWVATEANNQRGLDCNAAGPCDLGKPGGMTPIEPNAEDRALLNQVATDFVLKRWAKRCGTQRCVDEWNETIGKIAGLKASL